MLLTELAVALTAHLNSDPGKWTDDPDLVVTTELDPMSCTTDALSVHIIPNFTQYSVETSKSRGRRFQNITISTCSLIVASRFVDIPTGAGVANWSEAKIMLDTWQRAQEYLMQYSDKTTTLISVEAQNPEELEMDFRNFVAMTTFGYEQVECATAHESSYSLSVSTGDTPRRGIGASIRSRHSSG